MIFDKIGRVATETEQFNIEVKGLGIFPTAIYAKVTQGAKEISHLHNSIARELEGVAIQGSFEGPDFIPHVTLGHFATRNSAIEDVSSYERRNFGVCSVNTIEVVAAHLYRAYGPPDGREDALERIASFKLKRTN